MKDYDLVEIVEKFIGDIKPTGYGKILAKLDENGIEYIRYECS